MTREEAIAFFKDMNECTYDSTEAIKMAIKALEEQPSEDCISRKFMHDMGATCIATRNENGDLVALGALDILPSATPQPKTGKWVLSGGYWRCSECKEKALLKFDKSKGGYNEYGPVKSNYCPECGAKMQEDE